MSEHAELPWVFGKGTNLIFSTSKVVCESRDENNAAFIVKAVNNHDKLIKALDIMTELVSIAQDKYGSASDPVGLEVKKATELLKEIKKEEKK